MVRPTLTDLNSVEYKYYPFMFMASLHKCSGGCNVLSPKIYVPKETKGINAKAFKEHKCKCKFNNILCNSNKKCNNEICECKNCRPCKKIIVGILVHVFVRIASI